MEEARQALAGWRCTSSRMSLSSLPSRYPAQPPAGRLARSEFYLLFKNGAPERIRTSDPQIRSLVLYPAELRAHFAASGPIGPLPAKPGGEAPSLVGRERERKTSPPCPDRSNSRGPYPNANPGITGGCVNRRFGPAARCESALLWRCRQASACRREPARARLRSPAPGPCPPFLSIPGKP